MADIPSCLTDLKRPDLQALCKKYKIRANMKNIEMISALSEEREKFLSCHERESISQESHEKAGPQTKASNEREEEAMEEENKEGGVAEDEEMEISGSEKNLAEDSPQKPASDPVNTVAACDSTSDSNYLPSDELKDTSVNGNSNDNIISSTPFTACKDVEIKIKTKQEHNSSISINLEFGTSLVSPTSKDTPDSADLTDNNLVEDRIPDPTSNDNERSSKLNETFTIETPEKDIVMPYPGVTAFEESLNLTPTQKPSTPLRGVWALRESENTPSFLVDSDSPQGTDELCTKENDEGEDKEGEGAGCMSEAVGEERPPLSITHGVPEEKENTETRDYHTEIMSLLEKRVEETKSRPDYVPPPPTKIPVSTSRVPQTKTARKFDAAHRKEFAKMKSITDTEIRCKRPRIAESTPSTCNVKRRRVDVQSTPLLTSSTAEKRTPLTATKRKTVHPLSSKKVNTTFTKKDDSQKPRWR